jgi:hypothetical protein
MVCLLGWTASAAAQGVPACAPEKTLDVKLTTQEKGLAAPLVATHEAQVEAEISGTAIGESLTPPAGVQVTAGAKGTNIYFVVPATPSVPITVSWRQAADPSDPDSDATDRSTSCAASRVVTLPILAARPGHVVRLPGKPWTAFLAAVPALKRPDLSPLTITVRTSSSARFPAATAKAHTMVVPMLTASQVKYPKRLPGILSLSRAGVCRVYWLTCGAVSSTVSALELDTDAIGRGVEKPDLGGGVRLLARTQPARSAVRYGAEIDVFPGGAANRPFGFDVEIKQSGRVLARIRRAGRCHDTRDARGTFLKCGVSRQTTKVAKPAARSRASR